MTKEVTYTRQESHHLSIGGYWYGSTSVALPLNAENKARKWQPFFFFKSQGWPRPGLILGVPTSKPNCRRYKDLSIQFNFIFKIFQLVLGYWKFKILTHLYKVWSKKLSKFEHLMSKPTLSLTFENLSQQWLFGILPIISSELFNHS